MSFFGLGAEDYKKEKMRVSLSLTEVGHWKGFLSGWRWARSQNKPGTFAAQHLVGRHAFDAETDADGGDLDLFSAVFRNFVGYEDVAVRQGMGHQIVIGDLEEC